MPNPVTRPLNPALSNLKPSTAADLVGVLATAEKRVYAVRSATAAGALARFRPPWPFVIEEISATIIDNTNGTGGAGLDVRTTISVAASNKLSAVAEGDMRTLANVADDFQMNDANGSKGYAYGDANLTTQADGVARITGNQNDLVEVTYTMQGGAVHANLVLYEIIVARDLAAAFARV